MGDGGEDGSGAEARAVLASSATVECVSASAFADDTAPVSCLDDSSDASSAACSTRD